MIKLIAVIFFAMSTAHSHASDNNELAPAIEQAYESSDAVFIGTLLRANKDNRQLLFTVKEWFKGSGLVEVTITCNSSGTSCSSQHLKAGTDYVIYATGDSQLNAYRLHENASLSKPLLLAHLDVQLLRDMHQPFRQNDDSAWWFDE